MRKCPNCGAGLVFNPKLQKLQCQSCRSIFEPGKDDGLSQDTAKEIVKKVSDEYEVVSYKCSHCGAELLTTDETITTFCSYCRSGTMLDRKIIKKRKPDYVIPFAKTKKECEEIYVNKIKKSIFAPKSMIDTQEVEKIRGIYMPYWIYSYEKNGDVVSRGEKYNHRSGDYVYYDDYILTTNVAAEMSGISHDATSNFYDRLSESIAPYSLKEKKNFSPSYLSGYYADNEDVNDSVYKESSKEIATAHLSKLLGKEKEYREYSSTPIVDVENKSADLALFPVYFLATKNKQGDRVSYAVINGQTGKIAADIPIDFKKFGIFSLLLSILIFGFLNMFLAISINGISICSVIFSTISLLILSSQDKKIRTKDEMDIGIQSKKNKKVKIKKHNQDITIIIFASIICLPMIIGLGSLIFMAIPLLFKFLGIALLIMSPIIMLDYKNKHPKKNLGIYKPIIGLILTIAVFLIRPVLDMFYYIASLVSIVLSIWSFKNIIEMYNLLTTRKLPQLEKRGGDENA